MAKINILSVQMHPVYGDKTHNLQKAKNLVEQAHINPDLIVFPEFFTTGVGHDVFEQQAEEEQHSETLKFFSNLAARYNTHIVCGTIIERDGDKLYNTSYMIDRQGRVEGKYRKIHLFNYMGGREGECITPGEEVVVVNTDIGKIGMSVCFDIKFPLHSRELMKKGAQIIVSPAAWASPVVEEWKALNIVRASENAVFFVSSDLCGDIPNCAVPASGNSAVVNPYGVVLSTIDKEEGVIFAQIDLDEVEKIRKEFPVESL